MQKKGWFGVERNAKWGTGSKQFLRELFNGNYGKYRNFFNDILESLFYDALSRDRSDIDHWNDQFKCKIPFLNGGLFDPIGNYSWYNTDIFLTNELFSNKNKTREGDTGDGILDIFDRYNFTVKEDEPLEKEVAIDPELLGKIYEKFNAIRPDNYEEYKKALKSGRKGEENKFNKKFGVYYTPREIVHYMCQQSLINYLEEAVNTDKGLIIREPAVQKKLFGFQSSVQQTFASNSYILPKEDIEKLIYFGDQVSENEEIALIKEQNINEGKQKSSKIKLQLPESIRENAKLIDDKLAEITVCDPAVGSGAFPVGMMAEIVKTRNVLSAYIKGQNRIPYNFKRECIEKSLYGVDIDPGAVEIAKLRLWLSLIVDEEDIKNIKPLPNLDYKIVCGDSLLGYPYAPRGLEKIEQLKILFFDETRPPEKDKLKKQIDDSIYSLFKNTNRSLGYKVDFDFKINFSEAFHKKGGFDVVTGNPPYIRVDKIDKNQRKDYKRLYESASGKYDLYYLFFEKALKIINKLGCCIYISPNKFCAADSALKIRNLIFKKINLAEIISLSRIKVFEAAANYPIISLLKQTILRKPLFLVRQVKNLNLLLQKNDSKKYKALPEEFSLFPNSVIPINIDQKTFIFIKQLYSSNFYLSDVLSISEGLRIPSIYESETKHDYEIVKQYQFLKYSKIKLGTFISSSNLRQVIPDSAQRYKRIFMEKIVIAEDALSICATMDLQYRIPQGGVYFGVINNSNIFLKYILALLNSKLLSYIYEKLFSGMHMGGGYLRYRKKFLESLPLSIEAKNADKSEQYKIIEYVDNIYEINKDNCFVDKSIKKMKINKLEKQIDHIVYKLYGLNDEKISIVEEEKHE